jgi:hypothetical protein
MKKVIFITVRISTNSNWLNDKMLQLTQASQRQLSNDIYPIVVVDSYEEINSYMDQADWLLIRTAGDLAINTDHLWNKLHNIPEDVGIVGHIIWYPEQSVPHLHEQCFIINTRAFNRKLSFDSYNDTGVEFGRSNEDMNNGHAPVSVHLTDKTIDREMTFGSSIIEQSLRNGYRVVNFDEHWRYPTDNQWISVKDLIEDLNFDPKFRIASRGYFYPTIGPELFENCLKQLTVTDELEDTQRMIISIIRKFLEYQYVNIWQWDQHAPHIQADTVISPANGLLGETMALSSNAKKIIFYDLNPNNIEFKKILYTEWDGKDYSAFATKWAQDRNLDIEPILESAKKEAEQYKESNANVFNNWSKIKSLQIEFHSVDFLENIDMLLEREHNFYLHTSTILNSFIITNIKYSIEEINQLRDKINWYCKTNNGTWGESM